MIQKFQNHIQKNFPFVQDKSFYIAVSGGLDSMVLVHLFQCFKLSFGLLHCNFKLRGEESDADMHFIHEYAEENRLQLKIGFFETAEIAREMKQSIQVTARELRYNWFYEQMKKNKVDFVATAHHADDNLETFFINLSRGTGLDGLTGIPSQNDQIFRPLLPFSREEIENYAKENKIKWREDSSNASNKYLRNKIRHQFVPLLKEINPHFLETFQKTQSHLQDAQSLVNDAEYIIYKEVVTEKENGQLFFNLKKLLKLSNYRAYLYQWLKHFDFTSWNDIYDLVYAQSGKHILSKKFILLKNRDNLILLKNEQNIIESYTINSLTEISDFPLKLSLCNESNISNRNKNVIFVDLKKLQFPLIIRKWNEGDYFYPIGMKGKKKVSKFFKDEKLSQFDKLTTWILESHNKIVWIIGFRADDRFKKEITTQTQTQKLIKIEFNNEKNF